jgi:hypothetical protein
MDTREPTFLPKGNVLRWDTQGPVNAAFLFHIYILTFSVEIHLKSCQGCVCMKEKPESSSIFVNKISGLYTRPLKKYILRGGQPALIIDDQCYTSISDSLIFSYIVRKFNMFLSARIS